MKKNHNAHMLVPKDLWDRARRQAVIEGKTMTRFVCESLSMRLASRNKRRTKQ